MPRPRLGDDERRTRTVGVRVTEAEAEAPLATVKGRLDLFSRLVTGRPYSFTKKVQ